MILLTREKISLESVVNLLVPDPSCGAVVQFEGKVRNQNEGQSVQAIDYECYETMAQKELAAIVKTAKEKYRVPQIAVAHRLGRLACGETSLVVVAQSAHRQEGFEAVQYVIDQIKKKVPIWKKEIYEPGKEKWL